MGRLKEVFARGWLVFALLTPGVIIGTCKLITGGTKRLPVVGGGAVTALLPEDAPDGFRFVIDTRGSLAEAEQSVREAVTTWPDVLVFGLPAGADEDLQRLYFALTVAVENAAAVPVVVGPSRASGMHVWWRDTLCQEPGPRICVESEQDDLRGAIRAAIMVARDRHDAMRAATQVGR